MWLGVDLGTGSVKARLHGAEGEALGEGRAPCRLLSPRPGWAESDPEEWWRAVVAAVREATGDRGVEVRAVGLSGQMHGVVLSRADGTPLRPAILWADGRSVPQLAAYRQLAESRRRQLANPLVPGMAGPSLLWLRDNDPLAYRQARWALQPKDWLRLRLCGAAASDPSDASGTLLYDPIGDEWAVGVVESLDLRPELLAPVRRSRDVVGELAPGAARALGLPAGVPVVAGAADTAAAIHGSGLGLGEAQLTVGSGAQIVVLTESPSAAPELAVHLFRAVGDRRWYLLAALQNAGLALEWARDLLGLDWTGMYLALERTPPGSDGLLFLPYLTGERTPHLDPEARAGWLMASARHGRDHFARAAMEGVAFAITDAFEALLKAAELPRALRLAGGGSREEAWRRLLADLLGVALLPVESADVSVFGAARLAAEACGQELPPAQPGGDPVDPGPRPAALEESLQRFRECYRRLRGEIPSAGAIHG